MGGVVQVGEGRGCVVGKCGGKAWEQGRRQFLVHRLHFVSLRINFEWLVLS